MREGLSCLELSRRNKN